MLFEKAVLKKYNEKILARRDPDGTQLYFAPEDFPGLKWVDFNFTGDRRQRLYGHIYYRVERKRDTVLVFDHGMGCGHVSYMKEINLLTERGFTVVTYDHTGTRRSEGENIGGMSQSLADLRCCIGALKATDEYRAAEISVIGHSWGGFSTMNIPAFYPDIKRIVAISGFVSTHQVLSDALRGALKLYRGAILRQEDAVKPDLNGISAIDSIKNSSVNALIIHSRDDGTVSFENSFMALKNALESTGRVEFLALDGKIHHPTYTTEAVKYKAEFSKEMKRRRKRGMLRSDEDKKRFTDMYDFDKMTDQDIGVWDKIVEFLEGHK